MLAVELMWAQRPEWAAEANEVVPADVVALREAEDDAQCWALSYSATHETAGFCLLRDSSEV